MTFRYITIIFLIKKMNPTDIKKISNELIDFNSLLREHNIMLPSLDRENLKDIYIKFFGAPSLQPLVTSQALQGVRDLRFYINNVDYSKHLINEIISLLEREDLTVVKDQYLSGGSKWINYLKIFSSSFQINVLNEEKLLKNFVDNLNFKEQFQTIGNFKHGFGGNLNIVNFLYKDINLEPISLLNVINRKRLEEGLVKLEDLKSYGLSIYITQGPTLNLGEHAPETFQPRGRLHLTLESVYFNPIEPLIVEVLDRLKEAQEWIEGQRVLYLQPVKSEVETIQINIEKRFKDYDLIVSNLDKVIKDKFSS